MGAVPGVSIQRDEQPAAFVSSAVPDRKPEGKRSPIPCQERTETELFLMIMMRTGGCQSRYGAIVIAAMAALFIPQ